MARSRGMLPILTLAILLAACSRALSPTAAPLPSTPPTSTSPAPAPTPHGGGTPAAPGQFATLPSGSALPGDEECAARIRCNGWEPRPENAAANRTAPRLPARPL